MVGPRGLSWIGALFLGSALVASANPVDPDILIDAGLDPPGLFLLSSQLNVVQPDGTTPETFEFLNDTGSLVTRMSFETLINPGLNIFDSGSFSCNPNTQFFACNVTYNQSTGDLLYSFFATQPADGDETIDPNEPNEQEGLPPGADFFITLDGWTSSPVGPGGETLYNGLPTFTNSFSTPEPSSVIFLGTALLLVGVLVRRRNVRRYELASYSVRPGR